MLPRSLEPEWNDDRDESLLYDDMDHAAVNQQFVDDLVAGGDVGSHVLDLGTGTARIPIALCQQLPDVRVMAVDAAISMLELARFNLEIAGVTQNIQLEHADVKQMDGFQSAMCDCVISNSLLHHLPDPLTALRQAVRLVRPGGRLFLRDLMRPADQQQLEQLVQTYAGDEPPQAQQLLRQSLHAALTLDEARQLAEAAGLPADSVQPSSDRHWTLDVVVKE